mmetsp:Transcript_17902/g.15810  ORF Transcript_17902/g.15810 Transcript_17902/m.15810 type:complete len:99 (-) Transcript_17902:129-425(-)
MSKEDNNFKKILLWEDETIRVMITYIMDIFSNPDYHIAEIEGINLLGTLLELEEESVCNSFYKVGLIEQGIVGRIEEIETTNEAVKKRIEDFIFSHGL